MRFKTTLFILFLAFAFTSCKTYELMRYKGGEIDKKVEHVDNYDVYVQASNGTYKVNKPIYSPAGLKGQYVPVHDKDQAEEIKNPSTPRLLKKHKKDINFITKTAIKDTVNTTLIKKRDINEVSLVAAHSGINWKSIGEVILTVLVIAFSIGLIGLLVYWFTLV